MEWFAHNLAVIMFLVLTFIMFVGFPVAFVLGAVGIVFGWLGIAFGMFAPVQFANLLPRIYGQAVENQTLVAVPMFIFMGTILEKSGVAEELHRRLPLVLRILHIQSGSNKQLNNWPQAGFIRRKLTCYA